MKKWLKIVLTAVLVFCLLCGSAVTIDLFRTKKQTASLLEEAAAQNPGPFTAGDTASSLYHRIPSLLTLKDGTLIAAADARFSGTEDSPNNLDTVVSLSTDAGKSWGAATLANHFEDYADFRIPLKHTGSLSFARKKSASYIDPALVQDSSNGRVFMLTDLFPSGGGYWPSQEAPGSGYTEIDGKKYLKLRKKGSGEYNYTVRDGNVIYDKKGQPTKYSLNGRLELLEDGKPLTVRQRDAFSMFNFLVTKEGSKKVPMNIMYQKALFQPLPTSYLCLTYSDDGGRTWSDPRILNGMVKSDDMTFLGVGPGRGYQIENGEHKGRILFPVYRTLPGTDNRQACQVIYSDDHGSTWQLGKPPSYDAAEIKAMSESAIVELPGGVLQMFSRNLSDRLAACVSTDGGETWGEARLVDALSTGGSSCQISAVNYTGLVDGKPAVLLSTPAGNGRTNGKIHVGLVNKAEGKLPEISWKYEYEVTGEGEAFLYSCLTVLPDGGIGLLYEQGNGPQPFNMITYRSFTIGQLTGKA